MPFQKDALDEYLMRGDYVIRGDDQTVWLEGATFYSGTLPTDSPEGRLILCEAPYWGDDGEAITFVLKRIQAALTVCRNVSTEDLVRNAHQQAAD